MVHHYCFPFSMGLLGEVLFGHFVDAIFLPLNVQSRNLDLFMRMHQGHGQPTNLRSVARTNLFDLGA